MTSFQCFLFMYRVHRCTRGRIKAACLAVWDAVRPIKSEN